MAVIPFHKVTTMPGSTEPNAFYFVENGTYAEAYLTDSSGVAKAIGNSSMINTLISTALASWTGAGSAVAIVADITARDALVLTLDANAMILVVDASADATVNSGSALYAYDFTGAVLYKIAEYESMDLVLEWADIVNGPSSTPTQIDTAVSQSHTHANKAVLDLLTESVGNTLRFRGQPIATEWTVNNW